jgi:hypothetical protein
MASDLDTAPTEEQISERFRKLFGRDMTAEERRSLSLPDLPDEAREPARLT